MSGTTPESEGTGDLPWARALRRTAPPNILGGLAALIAHSYYDAAAWVQVAVGAASLVIAAVLFAPVYEWVFPAHGQLTNSFGVN